MVFRLNNSSGGGRGGGHPVVDSTMWSVEPGSNGIYDINIMKLLHRLTTTFKLTNI